MEWPDPIGLVSSQEEIRGHTYTQRDACVRTQGKTAAHTPRRGTDPDHAWTLDIQPLQGVKSMSV